MLDEVSRVKLSAVCRGHSGRLSLTYCQPQTGLVFFLPIFVQILSFLLFWPSLHMEKDVPLYVAEKEERPWSWGWSTLGPGGEECGN